MNCQLEKDVPKASIFRHHMTWAPRLWDREIVTLYTLHLASICEKTQASLSIICGMHDTFVHDVES